MKMELSNFKEKTDATELSRHIPDTTKHGGLVPVSTISSVKNQTIVHGGLTFPDLIELSNGEMWGVKYE
jgi:hypothetical protein